MRDALRMLREGQTLPEEAARAAFDSMLEGASDDSQIREFLLAIQPRGPTVDELVGAARAMRARVTRVPYAPPAGESLIDTCGTGGTRKTFNVSTAAALVVAGASCLPGSARRVRVAKHGNRSRTGRGSAEVLAALGVNVDAPPEAQARCLDEAGVCFCFAIHHHPAARHAANARREIGAPTMFNLLGPLTNPALAPRQLLGVFAPRFVRPMAEALLRLGSERAMVVHSEDGLDEISTCAPTGFARVRGGAVETGTIDPAGFGVARAAIESLEAASVEDAAGMILRVLAGEAGPASDIVALNAAAALVEGGAAADMPSALALAREAVRAGHAARTLDALARASRGA